MSDDTSSHVRVSHLYDELLSTLSIPQKGSDYDSTIIHIQNGLEHTCSWMTANLLTRNSFKTEFLLIGSRQQLTKIHNTCLNTTLFTLLATLALSHSL